MSGPEEKIEVHVEGIDPVWNHYVEQLYASLRLPPLEHIEFQASKSRSVADHALRVGAISPDDVEKLPAVFEGAVGRFSGVEAVEALDPELRAIARNRIMHVPGMLRHWVEKATNLGISSPEFTSFTERAERLLPRMEAIATHGDHSVAIKSLSAAQSHTVLQRVLARLEKDEGYFEVLDEIGLKDSIIKGTATGKFGRMMTFVRPESFFGRLMSSVGLGGFMHTALGGWIVINGAKPTTHDVLASLAESGTLPRSLRTVAHELTHRLQVESALLGYPRAFLASMIGGKAFNLILSAASTLPVLLLGYTNLASGLALAGSILAFHYGFRFSRVAGMLAMPVPDLLAVELQPREAEASSPISDDYAKHEVASMTRELGRYTGASKDPARFATLYKQVHTLRLLGCSDKEISSALHEGYYNPFAKRYQKLDRAVEAAYAKWGADTPEQREALYHGLETYLRTEREIQQLRARQIVSEELNTILT